MSTGLRGPAVLAALMLALCAGDIRAEMLVTADEAKMPASASTDLVFRGISRGPRVQVISPASNLGSITPPVDLRVKFDAFGGAKIDMASVRVFYLKDPVIDLTPRLKTYIVGSGIEMPGAELPPGDHAIRIEIKDTEGRSGSAVVNFNVAPATTR